VAANVVDSLPSLLTVVLCIDAALFVVLLLRSLAPSYHRETPPLLVDATHPG
jgi:hypothetical protein